jgi:Redoxin
MEGFLTAAVIVVGLIAVLDLLLTFGVVRRLREHTELIGGGAGAPAGAPTMLEIGGSIAPFDATTVDGEAISRDRLSGTTLIGVFGAGCPACEEKLPRFVEFAGSFAGGRSQVLAVVAARDSTAAAPYVDALTGVATVVRDAQGGPLLTALGVSGYPAFAIADSAGVVRSSSLDPAKLALTTPGSA